MTRAAPPYRLLRGVMTSWDNTPRRGAAAHLCHGSTPQEYDLAPGEYKLAVFHADSERVAGNFSEHRVVVEP